MADFDLVVLGSGPAGEKAAAQAAYFGKRVAIVEREPCLGGTCTNTGTLPSKTLRESALFLSGLRQRGLHGANYTVEGGITVGRLMYRKERVVAKQTALIAHNIARHHVELVQGTATLEDAHTVCVEKADGTTRRLTGDFVVIATGSSPSRPATIPFDDDAVCDSDTILNLDAIPRSLTVLGAGVIGCEYACIFAALGVEVVLLDARRRLLPFLDGEIASILTQRMTRLGIQILLGEATKAFVVKPGSVRTHLESGKVLETENLLFASGRHGNSTGLGLERLGIATNAAGHIPVNEHYQTVVPNIYAAGDVIGFPGLASTSMEQGRLASCHAFHLGYKTRLAPILPFGIYTIPEVSMAGKTEEWLRENNAKYAVGRASYGNNPRGQIIGDTEGLIKLIFDPDTGKILGVHLIGENATELVSIGMLGMHFEGTIDCFIQSVFNFPSLAEAYKYAAYDGLSRLPYAPSFVEPLDPGTASSGDKK
jgi:NAD(P) transhydrogenase